MAFKNLIASLSFTTLAADFVGQNGKIHIKTIRLAGVSSGGGLDDGLLVCTELLLIQSKLELIMSLGARFYFA